MKAYEAMLEQCSTDDAPWYVIPSNHKWFRNLAVSQIVAATLEDLKMKLPPPTVDIAQIRKAYHAAAKNANRDEVEEAWVEWTHEFSPPPCGEGLGVGVSWIANK